VKDRTALDRWLKRLLILAAWSFVAFYFAGVLREIVRVPPSDFVLYYFAGKLAGAGHIAQVYHTPAYEPLIAGLRAQHEVLNSTVTSLHSYYFLRPAFAAFFYIPYSWLSYRTAALAAIAVNMLLLGILIWKAPLWFPLPDFFGVGLFRALFCMLVGFRAAVGQEQDIILLTLLLAWGVHLVFEEREIAAGVVLAVCSFKPHLIWALPLALLAARKRKTLYAFLAAGLGLAVFSLAAVGPQGVREWIALLQASSTDFLPENMFNLRAVGLHFGWTAAAACAVLVLVAFGFVLRRNSFSDQVSAAVIVGMLVSPHTYRYDLSLLAIVALLAESSAARYLVLLPWLNFYPRPDLLPMVFGSLGYLIYLAVKPTLHACWPALQPVDAVAGSGVEAAGLRRDLAERRDPSSGSREPIFCHSIAGARELDVESRSGRRMR
jgi:Glycosyltransferase family 87